MMSQLAPWWADTGSWAVLLGVLTPILTGVVNQPRWPSWLRQIMAVVVALVLGTVYCLSQGTLSHASSWLAVVVVVLATAYTSYKTILGHVVERVEAITSGSRPPRAG